MYLLGIIKIKNVIEVLLQQISFTSENLVKIKMYSIFSYDLFALQPECLMFSVFYTGALIYLFGPIINLVYCCTVVYFRKPTFCTIKLE